MKSISVIALLLFTLPLFAQDADTTYWKRSGFIGVNFTQVQLRQWSQGGENSVAGLGQFRYNADYLKAKNSWQNSIDLGYGFIYSDDNLRKNEDKLDLFTKYGREAWKNWYYTALLNFKTQFTPGYQYPEFDSLQISDFMSPGYLITSAGLDYKPKEWFSLYLSPATGKFTFILDDEVDETTYGLEPGEMVNEEFGAMVAVRFQKDVRKNTNLATKADLFNNYTDSDSGNRKNIDVNWETTLTLKFNDYINASLFFHLIYDHDIDVPKEDSEGNLYQGKGTQMKEVLGVGLGYKF